MSKLDLADADDDAAAAADTLPRRSSGVDAPLSTERSSVQIRFGALRGRSSIGRAFALQAKG